MTDTTPTTTPETTTSPETTTTPEIAKNSINIDITNSVTLYDFTIKNVLVIPSTSATINIVIRTSHTEQERIVYLVGTAYLSWSADDNYLYDYIRENIQYIY